MATLQKFRNHGVLLLVIVGGALLAFILGDFLNSGSSFINRSKTRVATIAGQSINHDEWQQKLQELQVKYSDPNYSNIASQQDINEKLWADMLVDYALVKQAEKVGLMVSEKELEEQLAAIFGQNEEVKELYREDLRRMLLQQKYMELYGQTLKSNKLEAKTLCDTVDIEYVRIPYTAISDDKAEVSYKEIKKLYKAREQYFAKQPTRSISYIQIALEPDSADMAAGLELMQNEGALFSTTEDMKTFAMSHPRTSARGAQVQYNDKVNYSLSELSNLPQQAQDYLNYAAEGETSELFIDGTLLYQVRNTKSDYQMPDSIKVAYTYKDQTDTTAMLPHNAMIQSFPLSDENLEKVLSGELVSIAQEFQGDTIFMEVLEVSEMVDMIQFAIMSYNVDPSSETVSRLKKNASKLAVDNSTRESFEKAVNADLNLELMHCEGMTMGDLTINGVEATREVVRWAFENNKDDVHYFVCGQNLIVAAISDIQDGEFDNVRWELAMEIRRDKKAEYVQSQINGKSMEEIAKTYEVDVMPLNNATMMYMNMNPIVVSTGLMLKDGATSKAIAAEDAIYVVKASNKRAGAASMMNFNTPSQNPLDYMMNHEVEDNRIIAY